MDVFTNTCVTNNNLVLYKALCYMHIDSIAYRHLSLSSQKRGQVLTNWNHRSMKQAWFARRGRGIEILFHKTIQLISRITVDTRTSETLAITLQNARCTTRVIVKYQPPNSCFGTFLDGVSKVLLITGTPATETVVCGDFNTKYGDPTCTD